MPWWSLLGIPWLLLLLVLLSMLSLGSLHLILIWQWSVEDLIKDRIQEGPTLTFSVMMSGLDIIGRDVPYLSQSLTAMFSIMLLTIGMNSMIAEIFNIKYTLLDQYKPLRRYRIQLTFGLCAFFFPLSLPYCTSGGYQLFLAMDNSAIANNAIFVALLQLVLVGWVYGVKNFMDCVSKMGIELKSSTRWYFHACIRYICPFILTMLLTIALIHNFNNYQFIKFKFYIDGKTKNYKLKEAEPLVWMVQVFTLSFIPVMAIWKIWQSRNSSRSLCRATAQWVPIDEIVTTVVFWKKIKLLCSPIPIITYVEGSNGYLKWNNLNQLK